MKTVKKVVAYITQEDRILMMRHRDFPEIPMEPPAGTVDPGEELEAAVLREAFEETGLDCLTIKKYLGQRNWTAVAFNQIHERYFFHLEAHGTLPEEWLHYEMTPSGGDRTPVAYEIFWITLKEADSNTIAVEKGALLSEVTI